MTEAARALYDFHLRLRAKKVVVQIDSGFFALVQLPFCQAISVEPRGRRWWEKMLLNDVQPEQRLAYLLGLNVELTPSVKRPRTWRASSSAPFCVR